MSMRRKGFLTALTFLALSAVVPAVAQPAFQVVVHSSNPTTALTQDQLEAFYLKKTTRWSHGGAIEPVDQEDSRPVRQRFSEQVLGKNVSSMKSFWQARIFSGRGTPPLVLESDAEVLRYVATHPNALAYVSRGSSLGEDVKAVSLVE
jgi:ABC-type phosphate transport system substrate-binding protein